MYLTSSRSARPAAADPEVAEAIASVSEVYLRHVVDSLDYPRHYDAERADNRRARDWVAHELSRWGYTVLRQGRYGNVIAYRGERPPDRAPFWEAGVPAVMWTDTSEFRNPNYHQPTDTPYTLDYGFLKATTQLALARALTAG